jgi:hypothetical protein
MSRNVKNVTTCFLIEEDELKKKIIIWKKKQFQFSRFQVLHDALRNSLVGLRHAEEPRCRQVRLKKTY